jgi:uncharacterized protein YoxC
MAFGASTAATVARTDITVTQMATTVQMIGESTELITAASQDIRATANTLSGDVQELRKQGAETAANVGEILLRVQQRKQSLGPGYVSSTSTSPCPSS